MDKLIINAAITGAVHTKADNPNIPISPQEIVHDARRCRDSGASIVHVHARDKRGKATFETAVYGEILSRLREELPDLIICVSTSGRIFKDFQQRAQALEPVSGLIPDMASLTLGSLNFRNQASVSEPSTIQRLARRMQKLTIVPELELFELGMADYAGYLLKIGLISVPLYGNVILGSLGTLAATPFNLCAMVRSLPKGMTWSAGGLGKAQFFVNSMAITMGGHVRVGLEDSLFYDVEKSRHATNAGLIDRVVRLANAAEREIASPAEAREIIGLPQKAEAVIR